jgi:protein tyrosine phosphatase (PTP) superfamily phosphohydrolase (DUF442 family)
MTATRRPWVLVPLGILLLLVGVGLWVERDLVFYRLGTVREGVLYRSAQLPLSKLADVIDEVHLRTVVNLREVPNEEEARLVEAKGLRYVWLPSTQVPPPENIQAVLDLLDHPDNLPILVHCEHGVGRTGVITGVYRMEYDDWDAEAVLREARLYAMGGSYWDGQDKTEFLRHYVPRCRRGSAGGEAGSPAPAPQTVAKTPPVE